MLGTGSCVDGQMRATLGPVADGGWAQTVQSGGRFDGTPECHYSIALVVGTGGERDDGR